MAAQVQGGRRKGKYKADPEAPRNARELRVWRRIERCHFGLQRHAADRAASGSELADLRMHRAGIDRAFRHDGLAVSMMGVMTMAGVIVASAAAAGILCGAACIRVFGFHHRTLHPRPLATHTL